MYVFFKILACTLLILAAGEIGFRLYGYPKGTFIFAYQENDSDLYPPNMDFIMRWGAIPYKVHSNNFGFRGEDISPKPDTNLIRIAAIGDSFTDGFYVDDESTYPFQLQLFLKQKKINAEVLNLARAGASLDKEYRIMKHIALPLEPNLIILGFYSNDLNGPFSRLNIKQVISEENYGSTENYLVNLVVKLLLHSALLEKTTEEYLSYKTNGQFADDSKIELNSLRYNIDGMLDHQKNLAHYKTIQQREYEFSEKKLPENMKNNIRNYEELFADFAKIAKKNDAKVLLLLIPSYIQTYDLELDLAMNRWLKTVALKNNVSFYDLTDDFRSADLNQALYLSPTDFHLNPTGTKLVADLVGQYLLRNPELISKN